MLGKIWASAKAQLRCVRGRELQGVGAAQPATCGHAHSPASACHLPVIPKPPAGISTGAHRGAGSLAASPARHEVTFSVVRGGRWQWDPSKAGHADGQAALSRDTCFSKGRAARSAALPRLSRIQGLSGVN